MSTRPSRAPAKPKTPPPQRSPSPPAQRQVTLSQRQITLPQRQVTVPPRIQGMVPPPVRSSPPARSSVPFRPSTSPHRAEVQRRVDVFLAAGDAALKANDVIGAANNYRLALQNSDDPALRAKLDMVEAPARERRFELAITRARSAERDQRWHDAATEFVRAHEARASVETAERAAHAIQMAGGDLDRAASFAEWAVARAPTHLASRITLAEIYFAARLLDRASAAADSALALAPDDPRTKKLVAMVRSARGLR